MTWPVSSTLVTRVGCQTQLFSDKGFYKHLGPFMFLGRKLEFKPMPECVANPVRSQAQAFQQLQMQSHFSERNSKKYRLEKNIALNWTPPLPGLDS
jgi:hypothetical protein